MSKSPVRSLPPHANLEHLKKQAKRLLLSLREKNPRAKLAIAQLGVAREYGFASWRSLKAHIEAVLPSDGDAKRWLGAVGVGDAAAVRAMLSSHPRLVNATGPHPFWGGQPQALHVAIEKGHDELFVLLLNAGADPSGDNTLYDGWSPLMLAVHWNRSAMAEELRRRGAKVGLVEALMLGDDKTVEKMIDADAGVARSPMPNEATPLHFARTPRAAELLLNAGVAIDARDKYGKTALEVAASRGKTSAKLVRFLGEHGGEAHAGVYAAMGDLRRLKAAFKADTGSIRRAYKVGLGPTTPLHAAVERGHLKVVRWLLDEGVDANQRVGTGVTPLHSAAWNGQLAAAKLLVTRGADVNALDEEHGTTPARWARTNERTLNRAGCAEVAAYLESLSDAEK